MLYYYSDIIVVVQYARPLEALCSQEEITIDIACELQILVLISQILPNLNKFPYPYQKLQ